MWLDPAQAARALAVKEILVALVTAVKFFLGAAEVAALELLVRMALVGVLEETAQTMVLVLPVLAAAQVPVPQGVRQVVDQAAGALVIPLVEAPVLPEQTDTVVAAVVTLVVARPKGRAEEAMVL